MADALALFAQKILRKRGVEIILNDRLVAATSEKAILKSGLEIPCKTIISTVPSAAPPVLAKLDCQKDKAKLSVNSALQLGVSKARCGRSATAPPSKPFPAKAYRPLRSMPRARPPPVQ